MKLNEIDTSVYYPITIPSTKKSTKFRPFRVREEKALLTAQESEDSSVMLNTLESIVRSCVVDCPQFLTTFDIEYALIRIRSKSVGEESDITSTCTSCGHENNVRIDLTKVELTNPKQEKTLKLSEKLSVVMRYPGIGEVSELGNMPKSEQITAAIAASIETIYFEDSVFHTSDNDIEEVIEFIMNRTDEEMVQLIEFIENIPTVILETEYKCVGCGENNKIKIKTLSDFF